MRLTLTTFLTLDGVTQAPGGPDELVETRTTSTGVVVATYEPAGHLVIGSFELPSP